MAISSRDGGTKLASPFILLPFRVRGVQSETGEGCGYDACVQFAAQSELSCCPLQQSQVGSGVLVKHWRDS